MTIQIDGYDALKASKYSENFSDEALQAVGFYLDDCYYNDAPAPEGLIDDILRFAMDEYETIADALEDTGCEDEDDLRDNKCALFLDNGGVVILS